MSTPAHLPDLLDAIGADRPLRRLLTIVLTLAALVVVAVVAAALFTSFEAIAAYAAASGGIAPAYAWLVPLMVDSFIVVATCVDLWTSITTPKAAGLGWQAWKHRALLWLPKLLLGAAATGSFALNIAHAPPHLGARAVAAIPPLAAVLSFELLLLACRRAVTLRLARNQPRHGESLSAEAARPPVPSATGTATVADSMPLPALSAPPRPKRTADSGDRARARGRSATWERLATVFETGRPDGGPWTARTLAAAAGCGRTTAADYLRARRNQQTTDRSRDRQVDSLTPEGADNSRPDDAVRDNLRPDGVVRDAHHQLVTTVSGHVRPGSGRDDGKWTARRGADR